MKRPPAAAAAGGGEAAGFTFATCCFAIDFWAALGMAALQLLYVSLLAARGQAGAAALPSFPADGNRAAQALHVLWNARWYLFIRPAAARDWAWLATAVDMQGAAVLLLALAAAGRRSALWRWWAGGARDWVMLAHTPLARTLLHAASYLVMPRHRWAEAAWVPYTIAMVTKPVANAVFLAVSLWFVPVRFPLAVGLSAVNVTVLFFLAHVVGPVLLPDDGPAVSSHSSAVLLSRLPVARQVLVAVFAAACPTLVAWATEQQLKASYAREREYLRRQPARERLPGPRPSGAAKDAASRFKPLTVDAAARAAPTAATSAPVPRGDATSVLALPASTAPASAANEAASRVARAPVLTRTLVARPLSTRSSVSAVPVPAAGIPGRLGVPLPPYRGITHVSTLSVKVRQHRGTFEQYGTRLRASASAALLCPGIPVTGGCVVVEGCAQLIAWRHSLRRPGEDEGGGGGGDGVWSLGGLLPLLPQLLPDAELVGGVSVQAQAGAEREGGAEGGVQVHRWSPSASSVAPPSAPVRLLHLQPPALALPPPGSEAAESCGELRVTVASPRAQRCRLLLLGSGGVVLAEYGTELAAGEQELRVGVADVLRAAEAAGVTSGQAPLALRLALVPPAHSDEGGPGSSDGPLLHFSAPLLLLPAAPAAELAGLWSSAAYPPGGEAAAWCEVVCPLLQDLAFLADGAEVGEAAAAEVAAHVVSFLEGNGLAATAALERGLANPPNAAAATKPASFADGHAYVKPLLDDPKPPLSQPVQDEHPLHTAPATRAPSARSGLLRGFRPPALESSFWAWRVGRLSRTAPYLAALVGQPYVLGIIKYGATQPWRDSLPASAYCLLVWASDVAGCIPLTLSRRALASAAAGAASHPRHGPGNCGGGACSSNGCGTGNIPASQHTATKGAEARADGTTGCARADVAAVARAVWSYKLASSVLGPGLLLLAAMWTLQAPPFKSIFAGSLRAFALASMHRTMLLPSVQQAGLGSTVAALPLQAVGEALRLVVMYPSWGPARVVAVVAGWRLAAAAVAAAWEWRARQQFLRLVAAGAVHVEGVAVAKAGGKGKVAHDRMKPPRSAASRDGGAPGRFAKAPGAHAPPAADFAAYTATACFAQDLVAALGLLLIGLVAYIGSLVARGHAGPVLASFPDGGSGVTKALHLLRHAPWYLFVRPAVAGDWAWVAVGVDFTAVAALLLALAAAGRRSALWRWWAGGARDWVLVAHTPFFRTVLHAASYALLPRRRWAEGGYAPYTVGMLTMPVGNVLFLGLYCWFIQVRPSLGVAVTAVNLLVLFGLAYAVGPVLLPDDGSPASAQLLSRLPLGRQALVALFAAAWPLLTTRVRQHPGSFEQYGTRLAASAAVTILRPAVAVTSGCVVVEGCAQLIAWRHSLRRPGVGDDEGGGGGGEGVWSLGGLLPLLPQLLPDAELVGGVSVQAQAGAEREGGAEVHRWSASAFPRSAAGASAPAPVRLLHLQPPVLALPPPGSEAADACGELRVTVASPRAQRCRLLLLGSGGVVLAEYGTELAAGEQELRVGVADVLRAAEAVGATASGQAPLALRLALVPPAHSDEGGPGSSDGPLLHFSAPLLLLPAAPAAELAGLWSSAASAPCGEGAAWCEVVCPLLQDLAFLADGAAGAEVAAAEVAAHVVSFLDGNGLAATTAFARGLACPSSAAGTVPDPVRVLPPERPSSGSPAASGACGSATLSTAATAASSHSASGPSSPSLRHLLRGFRSPALESAFWAWRVGRLARLAPFLAALLAQPFVLGLMRCAAEQPWDVTAFNAAISFLLWASDVAGCIVLVAHRRACSAAAKTQKGQKACSNASGCSNGLNCPRHCIQAARAEVVAVVRLYQRASSLMGPALFLAGSVAAKWAALPSNDAYVGSLRAVAGASVHRVLLLPSVQQAGLGSLAVATPFLAIGEVLGLSGLQPDWGAGRVAAAVAGWRLAATAVAAAWEWRARRQFLRLVAAGAVHVESFDVTGAGAKAKTDGAQGFVSHIAAACFDLDLAASLIVVATLLGYVGLLAARGQPGAALPSFPAGGSLAQALHVLRHAPWYLFVRPAAARDWAWLAAVLDVHVMAALLLALAAAGRRSALWRWWAGGARDWALLAHAPLCCTALHVASYVVMPRVRWAATGFAVHTLSMVTKPVGHAFFLGLYCWFTPVRLSLATVLTAVNLLVLFGLAYAVGPVLLPDDGSPTSAQLLSRLPLGRQALVALFAAVWPLLTARAALTHLRKDYARAAVKPSAQPASPKAPSPFQNLSLATGADADNDTPQPLPMPGPGPGVGNAPSIATCSSTSTSPSMAAPPSAWASSLGSSSGSSRSGLNRQASVSRIATSLRRRIGGVPVALPPSVPTIASISAEFLTAETEVEPTPPPSPPPSSPPSVPLPRAPSTPLAPPLAQDAAAPPDAEEARTVQPMPLAPRAPVLKGTLVARPVQARDGTSMPATSLAGAGRPAVPLAPYHALTRLSTVSVKVRQHPGSFEQYGTRRAASASAALLCPGIPVTGGCVVAEGCAQLIAWRHSLRRPGVDGEGGGGGGGGVWSLGGLLPLLPQLLPDAELVGGVSAQAQAGAEREGGAEGGVEVHRWSPSGAPAAPRSAPVRLLHLQPPALALPPPGSEPAESVGELRVTVASPRAQRCRLLLLGSGGVVLADYGTELAAGEQELRVGVAEVLRAAEAVGATSGQAPLALRLALVPPAHSDEGGPGSSDGPLLHFSAPLLLLPAAPAAELAGLWSSAASAPCGEGAAWCEVVCPLLQDLAFLADGAAGAEAETAAGGSVAAAAAAAEVAAHVSSFLDGNGLAATAALARGLACPSSAAGTAPDPLPVVSTEGLNRHGPAASGASSSSSAPSSAPASAAHVEYAASPSTTPASPSLRNLLRGFWPPALGSAFWAWRVGRLARLAPFLAALLAQPFALGIMRCAVEQPWDVTVRPGLLILLLWGSDVSGCITLAILCSASGGAGAAPSRKAKLSAAAEAKAARAVQQYKLASALVGPLLFVVGSVGSRWSPLPSNDVFVGSIRAVVGATVHRTLLLPSVQQAGLGSTLAALPLLFVGEVLQLGALQPSWGTVHVMGVVAAWRLAAAVVAAAWEWRARRHFLRLLVVEVAHGKGGGGVVAGSGRGKAKLA
ncbi:hypothetical protein HYH03_001053 [Edaphochlamys debaryana]|uniref:Uncharacterized protein n=1 Tax=Edaphochlamys debaryana TaxID=47281 RepID=A0A835YHV9_9CHLO|nr:hypothetical protein HYH03_001053 [Edaphochlamys debaryana]|eukprot:KAG2501246.1 hypothetical protein HYH03_001053 [Edaphochlamys debaryana]